MLDINLEKTDRAIVLLAAYDSQALFLALQSLSKTIDDDETVVIVLNGKRGIRSAKVEDVAREWSHNFVNRHIVRPLNYGNDPYNSIKEVIEGFEPLSKVKYICKIDDDLIPLKKGWLDALHASFVNNENVGFVTSLINNNAWGFSELVNIFSKKKEYNQIMNYPSISGEGNVQTNEIANGLCGTIWQYPYIAKWCHKWTLLDINNFIKKTENLENKEISIDTHYSIGCIFIEKNTWSLLKDINKRVNFDELALHLYCRENKLKKIAVMSQPMGHLYYFIQRKANADLMLEFAESLADYWDDKVFMSGPEFDNETILMMQFEEFTMANIHQNLINPSFIERVLKKILNNLKRIFKA